MWKSKFKILSSNTESRSNYTEIHKRRNLVTVDSNKVIRIVYFRGSQPGESNRLHNSDKGGGGESGEGVAKGKCF
jgi:hypothetical protein